MGIAVHTVEFVNGSNGFSRTDRVFMGLMTVPYAAGGSAGASVSATAIVGDLPATAQFFFSDSADVTSFIASNVSGTLTITVEPRLASETVAAGSVGLLIVA